MSTDALHLRNIVLLPWQREAAAHILAGGAGCAWAGGKGSGKSVLVCYVVTMLCLTRPGAQVTLAMDTFPHLRDIHLPFLSRMLRDSGAVYSPGNKEFVFSSGPGAGSILRLRHLEMSGDPNSGENPLEGGNLNAVIVDESQAIDPRYWLVAMERARENAGGMPPVVVWSGLPINSWWCKRAQAAGWPVWRPRTAENARNVRAGYEDELRAAYTPAQAAALLDGAELVAEGQVFREYVAASEANGGHWTTWKPDPKQSRFALVLDPGIRWPHALLAARDDAAGRWVILHEWAPDDAAIGDVCRAVRRVAVPRREWTPACGLLPIDEAIMDPAGRNRGADGRSVADLMALPAPEGLGMRPVWEQDAARTGISDGCDRVNIALYRRALMFSADMMQAGLTAHPDRRTLARCMTGYRFDPKRPGEALKDNFNDHGADVVRYLTRRYMWTLGTDIAAGLKVRAPEAGDGVGHALMER